MAKVANVTGTNRPRVRVRMAQLLAETVRDEIVRSDCPPGTRLGREPELMERYDVSRPTLREGLRLLEADGFVSVRRGPGGGVFVERPGRAQLVAALRTGASIADHGEHDIHELRRLLDSMRELPPYQNNGVLELLADAVVELDETTPRDTSSSPRRLDVA
jgi:DNA-binding GntR family transcriptional regulator